MTMTITAHADDSFFDKDGRYPKDEATPFYHKEETSLHLTLPANRRRYSVRVGQAQTYTNPSTIEKKKQNIIIENDVRRMTKPFSRHDTEDLSHSVANIDKTDRKEKKELSDEEKRVLERRRIYRKLCRRMKLVPSLRFLRQLGLSTHLDLKNCDLQAAGMKAVCIMVMNDDRLRHLDVSGNQLGVRGLEYVLQLLVHNHHIQSVNLANNKIGSGNLKYITSFVLDRQKHVQKVDISGNGFNDNDGLELCRLIRNDEYLLSLRASNNQFSVYTGQLIGDALKENTTLLELDLSWNHIRGRGAEELAHGLMHNDSLISLNVAWNGFGHEGTCAMAVALTQNTNLEYLDMTCNRVHQKQLFELIEGLIQNSTLQILRLGHNPIPAAYTSTFLYKLKEAKTSGLRELDMSGVVVDKEFEIVLQEIQEERIFLAKYEHSLPIHVENWNDRFNTLHTKDVDKTYTVDPVRLFFYLKSNLRTVDMFNEIDINCDGVLSREEVRAKMLKDHMPISSRALDILFSFLDQDNNGTVDLLDFMEAERKWKRKAIGDKKAEEERLKTFSHGIDPNAGSKYSSTFYQYMTQVHTDEKERIKDKITNIMNKRAGSEAEDPNQEKLSLPSIEANLSQVVEEEFDKRSGTGSDYSDDWLSDSGDERRDFVQNLPAEAPLKVPEIKVSSSHRGSVSEAKRRMSRTPSVASSLGQSSSSPITPRTARRGSMKPKTKRRESLVPKNNKKRTSNTSSIPKLPEI